MFCIVDFIETCLCLPDRSRQAVPHSFSQVSVPGGRRCHTVCFGWCLSELCLGWSSDPRISAELPAGFSPLPGPSPPSLRVCFLPLSPLALIVVAAQPTPCSPSDGWLFGFATGLTLAFRFKGGWLMPARRLASIPIAVPAVGFVNLLQSCTTCLPGY